MCDLYSYILNFIFFCFLTTTVLITPFFKSLHFIFFDWLLEPNFGAGRCALASGERGGGDVGLDWPQGTLARPSFACWCIRRRLVAAMPGREDLSIRGFFLRGNLYFSARQKGGLLLRAGRGHHSGFEVGHHLCWRHISSRRVVVFLVLIIFVIFELHLFDIILGWSPCVLPWHNLWSFQLLLRFLLRLCCGWCLLAISDIDVECVGHISMGKSFLLLLVDFHLLLFL